MAKFNIISHNGAEKCWGEPRYEGSYMGVSSLKFTNISSPYPIKWQIGDFVGYYRNGMRFSLYSIPEPIKQANTGEYGAAYVYPEVVLYAPTKELEIAPFRDIVSDDNGIHFSSRPEVSTYEDVYGIARRIQSCMDDLYPGKWVIRVLDTKDENLLSTFREARAFSVSDGTCLDALSTIYDVWENIGWIYESNGASDIITIGGANERTESNTTDAFAYGKDNGLTSLKKIAVNEGEFATRLYVYGSERNIPPRYYNSQQIKDAESVNIPNLMIPMSEWGITDGLPDPRKAYIQADEDIISKYGLIPRTIRFDGNQNKEIFPSVEGLTEKQVREAMIAMGQGSSEYLPPASDLRIDEVYGSYIPDDNGVTINTDGTLISGAEKLPSTFQLEINSIGFDPMQQASLANEKNATLSFKSGKCAGRDFPIVKAVWNYGTWLLELERQVDDFLNIAFPNKDYPIVKGDQFAVLNIAMPQYYVTLAEKRMIEEGRKVLADYTRTSATYEPSIDPIKAHKEGWILKEGMYMKVYDRDIVDTPDNYDYILIDSISIDEASDIALYNVTLYDQKRSVSGLDALEGMIEDTNKGAAKEIARTRQFTERRFRSAEETLEMLAKAIEGYTEGISPITVRTMAMLVGNEALQYRFTSSRNSLVEIPCPISWDSSTQRVKAEASALVHLTLGVNEITTEGRRTVSSYKRWSIAYQNSEAIEDTEARYVYVRASKSDYSSTKLILSKDAISMEEESGYYHFLVGILNSENDGSRDFVTLYGFTEILPGQITTDVIRSADGKTYFDLANSEIGGRITFASGSSGLTNLDEWSGVQSQIDKANEDALKAQEEAEKAFNAQKAFAEQTTKDLEGLQDQIDGNITSWFYEGVPTLSNAPAKDWSTTDLKNNHLGDLYYDQNSGKAYRFQMNGTAYEWKLIADEDITKALELAGDAQDTADAKRRVFFGTSTPTGEKDKGDLWTNGTDLYVWNGTSWEKATKYTDDTTANAAISIAETAQSVANTASANATSAASLANDAKALAETAKGAAEEAEELIETANNYAKEAKEAAESSENAAKLSQQAAETAQQAVEDGQITVDESKRIAEDAKAASDAAQEASKEAEDAAIAAQQAAQAAQNLADEAKADAEKAAQDAEQAAADAKNASDRLNEWADDELVSPSDIPAIKNELIYIEADKADIDKQLEIYKSVEGSTFNDAYTAYKEALEVVLGLAIGSTFPDIGDAQEGYYTSRTSILDNIAKAAKAVADKAQGTADDAATEAENAKQMAEDAKTAAEQAAQAAGNAYTIASTASTNATNALTLASTANQNASQAVATANNVSTIANEALTTAQSAQVTATQAKTDADTASANAQNALDAANAATNALNDLQSDGVISNFEQEALRQSMAQISGEYQGIVDEAQEYNISSSSYTSAYSAAIGALNKYTADIVAGETIAVDSDYGDIASYYTAKATILAEIAEATKEELETAKENAALAQTKAQEAATLANTADIASKEAKDASLAAQAASEAAKTASEKAEEYLQDGIVMVGEYEEIAELMSQSAQKAENAAKEAEEAAAAARALADQAQEYANKAAEDAQKAAEDAKNAADEALEASNKLDEWASDGVISPGDKTAIANEIASIEADKADIGKQLAIYEIDSESDKASAYDSAYDAYWKELDEINKAEVGSEFPDITTVQATYYEKRTAILEAIAAAAKAVADEAQSTAEEAKKNAENAAKTAEEAKKDAEDALLAAQNAEEASQEAQQVAAAAQAKANEVSEKIDGDNYFTEIEKKTIRSIIAEITECREKLHENNAVVKFTTKQGHSWYLVKEDSYAEWTDANEDGHSVSQSKYAGYYSSNLHNANSYSVTQVDVELTEGREVDIQLDYFSDAESTNDWMTVGARGVIVTPTNTTTTSNTIPNRAGSTYGKQRMVFSKEYNMTQEVDAAKRYFQVAYKKNATIDVGTDSAYFRISNPHYIDESGSLHIIELKGSFHRYYLLLKQKGYTEVADMLYDALTEILGLLNANGLWTSGTTELTDGVTFRATLNEYLTDYYAILASCGFDIMDSKLADFDYLAGALKDGSKTLTDGGLIMTSLVAVGDTSTTNADVEAFMNGSDFCEDNEHGKLIHAMGIPRSVTEEGTEYTDLEKRSKAANTRIYEDGTIISKNAELNEGCVIGGTVKVTANGIEVDAPDAWGKLTISDQFGLRRQDGKLDVQIGGSCAGAGLNISNGTPAHGVCYVRGSEGYVCATFATTPGKRAIDIFDGMIGGMRPNTVFKSSGETLTHLDHTCFAAIGSIYLPSDPQIGQNYRIIHTSSSGLRVMIGTGDYTSTFKNIGSLTITNPYIQSNKIEMIELIYDGSNWWYMTSRND